MSALKEQVGGSHYKDMPIQPFTYIHENGIGFAEGTAITYISRWKSKDGVRDLFKAIHILQMLIEAILPEEVCTFLQDHHTKNGRYPTMEELDKKFGCDITREMADYNFVQNAAGEVESFVKEEEE